jgi:hypothetical protein
MTPLSVDNIPKGRKWDSTCVGIRMNLTFKEVDLIIEFVSSIDKSESPKQFDAQIY